MSQNAPKWTPNQMEFQKWLAVPKFSRTPPSQDLYADSIGINRKTLYRWKNLDGFMDAVVALARQNLRDSLPDIYGALAREAIKGSAPLIKLALEVTGEHQEKLDVTSGGKPIKGYAIFSPDDWDENEDTEDTDGAED